MSLDQQIRLAAFNWLSEQVQKYGDVLDRKILEKGFHFKGERVYLISPQGIFKPKQLDIPLTITTTLEGGYNDNPGNDGFIYYDYRGTNPNHRDNLGLKKAMEEGVPLIYFYGIIKGRYLPTWPVYIINAHDSSLTFTVAVDEPQDWEHATNTVREEDMARRAYITSTVKTRLHQYSFRERVIAAYRSQCAFCKLKHSELLDAAHIIPDKEELGKPTVDNGLALCKIHHTAFDRYILGVTPDYKIKVRTDVLEEHDGPMLKHGLQELHDQKLFLPKSKASWPNQDYLDWRYQKFMTG